jgi:hypothetical protein
VNYIREFQINAGVPRDQVYDFTMYILAGMLIAGFVCNLFIRPLPDRWFMKDEDVAMLQAKGAAASMQGGSSGIGRGGLDAKAALAWLAVGIPIVCGVWVTLSSAFVLFR